MSVIQDQWMAIDLMGIIWMVGHLEGKEKAWILFSWCKKELDWIKEERKFELACWSGAIWVAEWESWTKYIDN